MYVAPTANDYCHRCEQLLDKHVARNETEFELYVSTYGGYESFRDDMKDENPVAILCHDCAVELYRWLKYDPSTQKEHRGLHPDRNEGARGEPMCCEYAWRSDGPGGIYSKEDMKRYMEHGYQVNQ